MNTKPTLDQRKEIALNTLNSIMQLLDDDTSEFLYASIYSDIEKAVNSAKEYIIKL